ncbi:hybrid sensor histidine kinase/response regulator [Shumkonia mesophila]|uniref:hybrid sensor histidine kinase/response regulator n=1 Tax=Shumkonia mesophila TaxID=2838854 RepID=UPI002934F83A|nr:chemotaxis protein CheW [Shumkonia mesophila]
MDDLLTDFLTETSENLSVLDVELVEFERDPSNSAILQDIFRLVHTIKGTCGFLGLPRLETVAHSAENVLGKFRDGALEVTPGSVTLILSSIDRIKELLGVLEETGTEPEGEDGDLIQLLNAMAEGKTESLPTPAPAKKKAKKEKEQEAASVPVTVDVGFPVAAELLEEVAAAEAAGIKAASDEALRAAMEAERMAEASKTATAVEPAAKPAVEATGGADEVDESEDGASGSGASVGKRSGSATGVRKEAEGTKESAVASHSIRVSVGLLENLMTLVSELVLTRNQLLQMVRGKDDSEFKVPLQRLSLITSDLQEGVMKTRMQPIGNAWSKLPRIVRDLSVESGKKIELQMLGADTELDRQVLELIKDPLTHMVRNSADHGLEGPADRLQAGKPEKGLIRLNAYHEGGHIIIEISDDGRGLNTKRIRAKALANGMATEAELEAMTEQQIHQFIMRPGFSTAEKITNVSGRGVGMDVVRSNIEKIGGTIEFSSKEGSGSIFTIKIPLTLAIVSALIVECGGERFAIPQISVLELVRASAHSESSIELINEAPVLRLRDRLLPLVLLSHLLRLDGGAKAPDLARDEKFIVVCQVGTYRFGVIVDRVFDTEEIVVKPVSPILREISMFSGNTILGDGSVIMILDPNGIAATTSAVTVTREEAAELDERHVAFNEEVTSLLVFRAGNEELKAVPLALVARLEEIDLGSVEHSHGVPMVQYRGHIMPLVPFNPSHTWATEGRQPTIVFTEGDRSMGLVVDDIIDIVEDRISVELKADQPGLVGTAVVAGKATDVIDTAFYLTRAFSDWFGRPGGGMTRAGEGRKGQRLLLIDDSPFFRNLMRPQLSVAGYDVVTVEDAAAALKLRDEGAEFDAIISDIEMPGMSGYDLARELRAQGPWSALPLIALSTHAGERDMAEGMAAGFNEYVAKFNRDALVATVDQAIAQHALRGQGGVQ